MTLHTARLLYDGRRWSADGWLRIDSGKVTDCGVGTPAYGEEPPVRHDTILPGLVDQYARVTGYFSKMMRGDPLAPHRRCLALAAEAGVLSLVSVAGFAEPLAAVAQLAGPGDPDLTWTGPILDGHPVSNVATRVVQDPDSARRAVAALVADGAVAVSTGPSLSPPLVAEVVIAAGEQALGVTHHPGVTSATEAARAGVEAVASLPRCLLGRPPATTPDQGSAALIRAFANPQIRRGAVEHLRVLADHGTVVVPLLHAARRSAILSEAVSEPRLERLLAMAPFHEYLLDMRGPGMVFGRRYARDQFGYEHLGGPARREFDDGWAGLLECLVVAHELGVGLRAGSGALGLALVPGYALFDELAWWERAGLPRRTVLAEAAGLPGAGRAGRPGLSSWPTGVLALPVLPEQLPSLAAMPGKAQVLTPAIPARSGWACDPARSHEAHR